MLERILKDAAKVCCDFTEKDLFQCMEGVKVMEVIEVADKLQNRYLKTRVLAWYIVMKNHKILFATGEPGNFWRCTETMKLPMDEIDMLFLSQGYQDSIRELEYFLTCNNKAKIYVSRKNNETYLRAIYYKLFSYTGQAHIPVWEKRIIFIDDCCYWRWSCRTFLCLLSGNC